MRNTASIPGVVTKLIVTVFLRMGQRSLTPKDQALINKMRKDKGTEKGSVRFIAEELKEQGNPAGQKLLDTNMELI